MKQQKLAELKNIISGEVVTPSDTTYRELSNVFVRAGSPAMVVRCRSNDDVATSIQFAQRRL